MEKRLQDFFLGLTLGFYFTPTITIVGFTVPWVLVGLGISYVLPLFRKLGRFLWNKLIQAIKNELAKETT